MEMETSEELPIGRGLATGPVLLNDDSLENGVAGRVSRPLIHFLSDRNVSIVTWRLLSRWFASISRADSFTQ